MWTNGRLDVDNRAIDPLETARVGRPNPSLENLPQEPPKL